MSTTTPTPKIFRITLEVAKDALNRMEVDTYGLDEMDRKLLSTIIEKFEGGPVGVGTLSAAIQEERDSQASAYPVPQPARVAVLPAR